MSDSPIEAIGRFDRARQTVGLVLGPLAFLIVLASPTGLPSQAHRLAAVFALVVVFWITEAIPLPATALLGPALTVPLGVAGAREAFASFGHPIIFLFLGSFLISGAMIAHGLDRRIALFVLSRRWVGEHPGRILLAFGAIAAGLSMWMSNTATTAMMLPIGLGVLRTISAGSESGSSGAPRHYATALMLMIAFSCNVGGIATPVGSPPNLIAIGMVERIQGRTITFFDWMRFALPITVLLFAFLFLVIRLRFAKGEPALRGAAAVIRRQRAMLGSWSRGEKGALAAFLCAVTLWVLPGAVRLILGGSPFTDAVEAALPEGPVAILAACLLFLWPVNWPQREFALRWRDAVKIDWGTILLFGGGLSLGSLAFSSGLAEALGHGIERASHGLPFWAVVLLAVLFADLLTELMSNTATANLLVPIFLAIGVGATGDTAILPAIGATLGCSLAFCLPVATPPNAIVYGSGHIRITEMVQAGVILDLGCGLLTGGLLLLLGVS